MKSLISMLMLTVLAGCATAYQPSGLSGGYNEAVALGNNRYLVSFDGNGYTSRSVAQSYAIRRAKEVCEEKSSDFEILQIGGDTSSFQTASTTSCYGSSCTTNHGYTIEKPTAEVVVQCKPRLPAAAVTN